MRKSKLVCAVMAAVMLCTYMPKQDIKAATAQSTSNYNYGEALQKAIMFYEFQRSGKLPDDMRNNWRGDSGLDDGSDVGLDLTGGWYDAGDNAKFNLPMAYTDAMLAWTVYEEADTLEESGQLDYMLNEIRWTSDYLIKCHPSKNVYYYQVGDGNKDHSWWGPAEVMQMERPSFKVDMSNPGSAVSGEAAAALAATAAVFKDRDPAYASLCLKHAKELFDFADTTKSDAGYTAANGFYNSWSGFYDELTWAGAWLYIATEDEDYLDKAEKYVSNWGTEPQTTTIAYKWGHNWDDVHNGACLLLAKLTGKELYKKAMEMHLDYWSIGYNGEKIKYTPKGLAWCDQWGSLRYSMTTSFLADVYADWEGCSKTKADAYHEFARKQVEYALGSTGRSFVVGFGKNAPKNPHHRNSHSSWADSQTVPAQQRHVLYGALVGGPDASDGYEDSISNYVNNEVACDYNAGFVGALTKAYKYYGGTPIPNFTAFEEPTNDEFFVEAGINASGQSFTEIKAILNNRSGWPAKVGDKLSFKYFFDISEYVKKGYSIKDITVKTNYNNGAKVTGPFAWDASKNIYYVNADFTGTKIYPGGQSQYKKELQFRIAGPENVHIWDSSNDYSFGDITNYANGKTIQTKKIPVYDNGVKVYGDEPGDAVVVVKPSTITPKTASFDKADQADVVTNVTYNGNTLVAVKNGSKTLVEGTDYTVSGNKIIIAKEYLASLTSKSATLTFEFSAGADAELTVSITEAVEEDKDATISPNKFNMNLGDEELIVTNVDYNSNKLVSITNGETTLVEDVDYYLIGEKVVILDTYTSKLPAGKTTLTYNFDKGNSAKLVITVTDTTVDPDPTDDPEPTEDPEPTPDPVDPTGAVKVEMMNTNTNATSNGIMQKFRIKNTSDSAINLSDLKLRYYYTVDGELAQNFWCDYSSIGSENVVGTFVKADASDKADYYLEITFKSGAGVVNPGAEFEVQGRFSKSDWSMYDQANDYSFNATATSYEDWEKVTAYVGDTLVWGMEP